MFSASLIDKDGDQIGKDYNGYVPNWMPGQHYGDYILLDIDVETGKILNWKPPTEFQLKKTFNENA